MRALRFLLAGVGHGGAVRRSDAAAGAATAAHPAGAADRRVFDGLLDGLARAGLVTLASETFTNPEGREVTFRKAALTLEGRSVTEPEPLGVLLRSSEDAAEAPPPPRKKKSAARGTAGADAQGNLAIAEFTPAQTELETRLRAWRKAEAAAAGKPAFFVLTDAALRGVVLAGPRTLAELLDIHGIGPVKADRYGASIVALCRGGQG